MGKSARQGGGSGSKGKGSGGGSDGGRSGKAVAGGSSSAGAAISAASPSGGMLPSKRQVAEQLDKKIAGSTRSSTSDASSGGGMSESGSDAEDGEASADEDVERDRLLYGWDSTPPEAKSFETGTRPDGNGRGKNTISEPCMGKEINVTDPAAKVDGNSGAVGNFVAQGGSSMAKAATCTQGVWDNASSRNYSISEGKTDPELVISNNFGGLNSALNTRTENNSPSLQPQAMGKVPTAVANQPPRQQGGIWGTSNVWNKNFVKIDQHINWNQISTDGVSVWVDKEAVVRNRKKLEGGLVGRILGRRLPFGYIKSELHRRWGHFGAFQTISVSEDCFICTFESDASRDAILQGGPWFVGGHVIGIDKWSPSFSPSSVQGMFTPLWVRLPNLPLLYWDKENIARFAAAIGQPLWIDSYTSTWGRCSFARICVRADLSKSLPPGVWINDEGQRFFQKFEYEGVSHLCFNCGMVGHKEFSCPSKVALGKTGKEQAKETNHAGDNDARNTSQNADSAPSSSPELEHMEGHKTTPNEKLLASSSLNRGLGKCTPVKFIPISEPIPSCDGHGPWSIVARNHKVWKQNNVTNAGIKGKQQIPNGKGAAGGLKSAEAAPRVATPKFSSRGVFGGFAAGPSKSSTLPAFKEGAGSLPSVPEKITFSSEAGASKAKHPLRDKKHKKSGGSSERLARGSRATSAKELSSLGPTMEASPRKRKKSNGIDDGGDASPLVV